MKIVIALLLFVFPLTLHCQSSVDSLVFTEVGSFEYPLAFFNYHAHIDRNNLPYIYSCGNEKGLVVFDISNLSSPVEISSFPPSFFGNHKVNNATQIGDDLYLSLGSFQGATDTPGVAIMDVSDPTNISLRGKWMSPTLHRGCTSVKVDGDYAYLSAMADGIIILNVADPQQITLESQFPLDNNWPPQAVYAPHSRGLDVRNDTVFVTQDAGGLRLVDVSNKQLPVEIHKYVNQTLLSTAYGFYNNVAVVGRHAFIALDYCGVEVAEIGSNDSLQPSSWYNPWNCDFSNWVGRPGHTNELTLIENDQIALFSGGETECIALDLSDPSQLRLVGEINNGIDSAVVWGIDAHNGLVCLAFIDNHLVPSIPPFIQPFFSNFGGFKLYQYQVLTGRQSPASPVFSMRMLENPVADRVQLEIELPVPGQVEVQIFDLQGRGLGLEQAWQLDLGKEMVSLDVQNLEAGIYLIELTCPLGKLTEKFILQR